MAGPYLITTFGSHIVCWRLFKVLDGRRRNGETYNPWGTGVRGARVGSSQDRLSGPWLWSGISQNRDLWHWNFCGERWRWCQSPKTNPGGKNIANPTKNTKLDRIVTHSDKPPMKLRHKKEQGLVQSCIQTGAILEKSFKYPALVWAKPVLLSFPHSSHTPVSPWKAELLYVPL